MYYGGFDLDFVSVQRSKVVYQRCLVASVLKLIAQEAINVQTLSLLRDIERKLNCKRFEGVAYCIV